MTRILIKEKILPPILLYTKAAKHYSRNLVDSAFITMDIACSPVRELSTQNSRKQRKARINIANEILGKEASKNFIKRTLVSQTLRLFQSKFPEKFQNTQDPINFFQALPYHVQTFIKYIADIQTREVLRLDPDIELKDKLQKIIRSKIETGQTNGTIGYSDYGWIRLPNEPVEELLINGAYDTGLQLNNSLGYANWHIDEDNNEIVINDCYDFNHYEGKRQIKVFTDTTKALASTIIIPTYLFIRPIMGIPIIDMPINIMISIPALKALNIKTLLSVYGPFLGKPFQNEIRIPLN